MTFSLARMRQHNPQPPFWVGGEYVVIDGHPFLQDAYRRHELVGEAAPLSTFCSGDLALVEVREWRKNTDHQEIHFTQAKRIHVNQKERARSKTHALRFPEFVDRVREILKKRGLSEIYTPTLVACPGLEPSLEPFSTLLTNGPKSTTMFLPTSPEVHLKKAMARGLNDIFEIRRCFRRGEFSALHENEFTMLEWYRGFSDLELVIADLENLLEQLSPFTARPPRPLVTDFATLFLELLNFKLTPQSTAKELSRLVTQIELDQQSDDTFADLFHRIMISKIEPALKKMGPVIVRRFPPSMAALARLDSNGWADRFEFYWEGMEIANAFFEVTDAEEQIKRWKSEQAERARLKTTALNQDEEMIEALRMGIPPTGGIALGLERLYMAFAKVTDIAELKSFPDRDRI